MEIEMRKINLMWDILMNRKYDKVGTAVEEIFDAPPAADCRPIPVLGLRWPESAITSVDHFERRWGRPA